MADPIFKDVRFDALRNAIYHTERRTFLDLLNRLLNFLVIILGTGVIGKAALQGHTETLWLEIGVVFFATLQLVFDFGGRARAHEFLQKRYYELLAEMESENLDSEPFKIKWSCKLLTLAGDEPMAMRALDALAYNKALSALVGDPDTLLQHRQRVTWWQRRMRHIFAFHSAAFPPEASYQKKT